MFTININGNSSFKTNIKITGNEFEGTLNDKPVKGSFIKINPYQFHLIYNNNSYNIDLMKMNRDEKTITIKVNSAKFHLQLKDKYDELLHSLGLDNLSVKKVSDVKAPMPGMVLSVLVQEGLAVKKGDALIILEAMKMENILKSPSDGIIKKIIANKGKAVEKNEILIHCKQVLTEKVHSFKDKLNELVSDAENDSKSSAGDKHETSRAMMQIEYEKISRLLKEMQRQKNDLEKVDIDSVSGKIKNGSIIKTNNGYLFLGAAVGKIEVDGIPVMSITPGSPIGRSPPR